MKKTLILIYTLVICHASFGQDAKEIIQKIGELYSSKNSFEYDLSYSFYEDINSSKPYKTLSSSVKSSGTMYYIKTSESLTLQNSKYLVMIDHSRKLVMIDQVTVPAAKRKKQKDPPLFSVDSLLRSCQTVDAKIEGNSYVLSLKMKADHPGKIERAIIRIKKATYQIELVTMFYQQMENPDNGKQIRPWVSMSYRNFTLNSPEISRYFDETAIFSVAKNGTVTLTAEYKKYNLLSHL